MYKTTTFIAKIACLACVSVLTTALPSMAQNNPTVEAVRDASSTFVEAFNDQDVRRLGRLYWFDATLKLPDAPATNGRKAIKQAWQGGFDNGLSNLTLTDLVYEDVSRGKVVETGNYELEINTPDGTLLQSGTFSVQWEYNWYLYRYFGLVRAKIDFDTIDAQTTVPKDGE